MTKKITALLLCLIMLLTMIPVSVSAAQTPLKITQQPKNGYAKDGKIASTTVSVQGDGVSFQWYLQNPGQEKFYESAVTSGTYSMRMTKETSGRKVYCVITDRYGNSVTSKTVELRIPSSLKITQQPENGYAADGETVRTSVTAKGDQHVLRNATLHLGKIECKGDHLTRCQHTGKCTDHCKAVH